MKKLMTALLTAMWLIANSVYAADAFEYANKSYDAKNYTQAFKLFKQLALKGNAEAQYRLGGMYAEGKGVLQDYGETFKWWKLAAAQGDAEAQSNLGYRYADGEWTMRDYVTAHMWLNLAAAQGYTIPGEGRDNLAIKMTPQQIAKAQKLARECLARNYKNC